MSELTSYVPLYNDVVLRNSQLNEYVLPVGGSVVSSYLPTIEATSDLTATMAG
jgi:hypothetical protein